MDTPASIKSEELDICGHKITCHVLDNGQRIFEHSEGLIALMAELGVDLPQPPNGADALAAMAQAAKAIEEGEHMKETE